MGDHRASRTPRRQAIIAATIVLVGSVILGGLIFWQETRLDDDSHDLGCAFSAAQGLADDDCR